jgi:hypothetical protein
VEKRGKGEAIKEKKKEIRRKFKKESVTERERLN